MKLVHSRTVLNRVMPTTNSLFCCMLKSGKQLQCWYKSNKMKDRNTESCLVVKDVTSNKIVYIILKQTSCWIKLKLVLTAFIWKQTHANIETCNLVNISVVHVIIPLPPVPGWRNSQEVLRNRMQRVLESFWITRKVCTSILTSAAFACHYRNLRLFSLLSQSSENINIQPYFCPSSNFTSSAIATYLSNTKNDLTNHL